MGLTAASLTLDLVGLLVTIKLIWKKGITKLLLLIVHQRSSVKEAKSGKEVICGHLGSFSSTCYQASIPFKGNVGKLFLRVFYLGMLSTLCKSVIRPNS